MTIKYICNVCKYQSSHEGNVKKHMTIMHGHTCSIHKEVRECPYCDYSGFNLAGHVYNCKNEVLLSIILTMPTTFTNDKKCTMRDLNPRHPVNKTGATTRLC